MVASEEGVIKRAVYKSFEIGKSKDIMAVGEQYYKDKRFSRFGDVPPYKRLNYDEACMYKELYFASVSDYDFKISDLEIDFFDGVAIATFNVEQKGMLVDNKSFTGRTMNINSRGTMVFLKKDLSWLIIHEHFSSIPTKSTG